MNFGRQAEERAKQLLIRLGYKIIDQNWNAHLYPSFHTNSKPHHPQKGEIDLIAISPQSILCFIEVKARRGSFQNPLAAITPSKQSTIKKLANIYIYRYQMHQYPVRFEVIGLNRIQNYWKIQHLVEAYI